MTYKQALKVKVGDKLKQKMHGYVLIVQQVQEHRSYTGKTYIMFNCQMVNKDSRLKCNHKEVSQYSD